MVNFRGGDVEEVETYSVWRPFTYKDFGPVGDVIFPGEQVPEFGDGDLTPSQIVAEQLNIL